MKAVSFGERFLATLAEHVFDEDGEKINLTVSIGIAGFPYDVAKNESGKTLINRADKALLQVKSSGRNRVAVAP
jgi:diguanylate cyclase (GGDEF)-like protein